MRPKRTQDVHGNETPGARGVRRAGELTVDTPLTNMGLGRVELPTSRLSGPPDETGCVADQSESAGLPSARPALDESGRDGNSPSARTQDVHTNAGTPTPAPRPGALPAHVEREMHKLRRWANRLRGRYGVPIYLVGSALREDNPDPRDWDIRIMLPDDRFALAFGPVAEWRDEGCTGAWTRTRFRWSAQCVKDTEDFAAWVHLNGDVQIYPESHAVALYADKPRVRLDSFPDEDESAPRPEALTGEADCDVCGKPLWAHTGPERFCPVYATYRNTLRVRLAAVERERDEARRALEKIAAPPSPLVADAPYTRLYQIGVIARAALAARPAETPEGR